MILGTKPLGAEVAPRKPEPIAYGSILAGVLFFVGVSVWALRAPKSYARR